MVEVDGIGGDGGVNEGAICTTQTHERIAEGQQLGTLAKLAEILLEGKYIRKTSELRKVRIQLEIEGGRKRKGIKRERR